MLEVFRIFRKCFSAHSLCTWEDLPHGGCDCLKLVLKRPLAKQRPPLPKKGGKPNQNLQVQCHAGNCCTNVKKER